MALNPFFLHGSQAEQRLVQELINEQLRMYGIEIYYIPRKIVRRDSILRELQSSKFDDNFALEAYINTYEGHTGAGDILTKFGMSLRDELTVTISKERFEDFISPFLESMDQEEIDITDRPREGDIIYFPLGQRLFEVKFVEHESPFYQLGKTYVYELKCELFEYEDEIGGWDNTNTTTEEIDSLLVNQGYITNLYLYPTGIAATATATIGSGYVQKIFLNNDGYGYTSTPVVSISTSPSGGTNATAVAITTSIGGVDSIKEILLINAGSGYTEAPTISISGGGGTGAAATCGIITDKKGITRISVNGSGGVGYSTVPNVSITLPPLSPQISPQFKAVVSAAGTISEIRIVDAGAGYLSTPTVTVAVGSTVGFGTFWLNEVVTGSISGTTARVKTWTESTSILKVGTTKGDFVPGDIIVGSSSYARYSLSGITSERFEDKYEQNDVIEEAADIILDFSEANPFGNY